MTMIHKYEDKLLDTLYCSTNYEKCNFTKPFIARMFIMDNASDIVEFLNDISDNHYELWYENHYNDFRYLLKRNDEIMDVYPWGTWYEENEEGDR